MVQLSATARSPLTRTGTFSEPCGAMASFSVNRQGIDSASSLLWGERHVRHPAIGLKRRPGSVPTSS